MEQEQTSTKHRFIKYMKKNVPIVYDFITYVEHKKCIKIFDGRHHKCEQIMSEYSFWGDLFF